MTQIFQAASRQVGSIFAPEPPPVAEPEPKLEMDLDKAFEEQAEVIPEAIDDSTAGSPAQPEVWPVGAVAVPAAPSVARTPWEEDTQIELPDVGTETSSFDFGQFQSSPTQDVVALNPEPMGAESVADSLATDSASDTEPEVDLLAGLAPPPVQLDDSFEMPEISFEPEQAAAGASLFDMLESELDEGATAATGLFEELVSTEEVEIDEIAAEEADPFGEVAS
jgi:hypothetical protein